MKPKGAYRMLCSVLTILLCLSAFSFSSFAESGKNLFKNPDFETSSDGWRTWTNGSAEICYVKDGGKDGSGGMMLKNTKAEAAKTKSQKQKTHNKLLS